ncbi:MAG: lysine biosynthesis protein LysX [Phycisphaerales bacterium]|nr:MAG: lysine biosynthesis protein LysX [Phycisphaerales bacterium]
MRIAFLHTRIRVEERLLLDELERRGVEIELLHADEAALDITADAPPRPVDALFDRCLSNTKACAIVRAFTSWGVPCVNPPEALENCADKGRTTALLRRAGVPSPRTILAFSPESALDAADDLGYPVVLKPAVGSWGRLVARLRDRDALEAVLEHKATLGGVQHGVIYLQEHVDKPGRDIRAFVVGGRTLCAVARYSEHWITNTARGGRTENVPLTPELDDLCARAARAVDPSDSGDSGGTSSGGGAAALAIDILEHPERGPLVNEVNATMEFRNSIAPTGVDIPAMLVEHVLARAEAGAGAQGAAA